jgi:hypothetical protein
MRYLDISAKCNYQIGLLLVSPERQLLDGPDFQYRTPLDLARPVFEIDPALSAQGRAQVMQSHHPDPPYFVDEGWMA